MIQNDSFPKGLSALDFLEKKKKNLERGSTTRGRAHKDVVRAGAEGDGGGGWGTTGTPSGCQRVFGMQVTLARCPWTSLPAASASATPEVNRGGVCAAAGSSRTLADDAASSRA